MGSTAQGGDVEGALARTMQTAERTVLFSGLTVAISLLSLLVFPQMFLKSMGIGGAAAVLVAMLAAMTLLPAALALLGHRVNSLHVPASLRALFRRRRTRNPQSAIRNPQFDGAGFWYRLSHFVMRRPVTVLIVTLIPLALVGLPFLRVNLSVPDARSLPKERDSPVVFEMLQEEFPRNETQPITAAVHTEEPALDSDSLSALYDYTRRIEAIPGVRRIDSLVTLDPRLDKAAYQLFYSEANRSRDPRAAAAAERFSKGNYSTVTVLYDSDPLSAGSQEIVRAIRALDLPPAVACWSVVTPRTCSTSWRACRGACRWPWRSLWW